VERIVSVEEVRRASRDARREGKLVGLVPTMGALHAGHMSLVDAARRRADVVVVSIFVNPTQFGEGEDFAGYPRDLEGDLELLGAEGVDVAFTPSVEVMYPEGADTAVAPGRLAERWCGEGRPGHFEGVATVVAKLFGAVEPHLAFFGEKDYQQLLVVRALARDLLYPVTIVGCPIVREADGLAMSSRNAYLDEADRAAAAVLDRALAAARAAVEAGDTDGREVETLMETAIAAEPRVELEYAAVVDAETLEPARTAGPGTRALVAARVGGARLIDNAPLG
jgi:pantoate--beta-alanine ligase